MHIYINCLLVSFVGCRIDLSFFSIYNRTLIAAPIITRIELTVQQQKNQKIIFLLTVTKFTVSNGHLFGIFRVF